MKVLEKLEGFYWYDGTHIIEEGYFPDSFDVTNYRRITKEEAKTIKLLEEESEEKELLEKFEPKTELEVAKQDKLDELEIYDKSPFVNEFIFHGKGLWLNKYLRLDYMMTLMSMEILGYKNTLYNDGEKDYTLSIADARKMLAKVHLYADQCFVITNMHKQNILDLETVDEVKNYNFKEHYPPKVEIK